MNRRKIRRFLVTVTEVAPDPIVHQEPAAITRRGGRSWWLSEQQKRERATAERLARLNAKRKEGNADI